MRKKYLRLALSLSLIILLVASCGYQASADGSGNKDEWAEVEREENAADIIKTDVIQTGEKTNGEETSSESEVEVIDDESNGSSSEESSKESSEETDEESSEESSKESSKDSSKEEKPKPTISNNSPFAVINLDGVAGSVGPGTHTISNNVNINPSAQATLTLSGAGSYILSFTSSTSEIIVDASAASSVTLNGNIDSGQTVTIIGLSNKSLVLNGSGYNFDSATGVTLSTSGINLAIPAEFSDANIELGNNTTITGTTTGTINLNGKKATLNSGGSYKIRGSGTVDLGTTSATTTINLSGAGASGVIINGTGQINLIGDGTGIVTLGAGITTVDIRSSGTNSIKATGNLSINGTTSGTIDLGGKEVTLKTAGTHKPIGNGTVNLGTNDVTLDLSGAGTSVIKVSGAGTIKPTGGGGNKTLDLTSFSGKLDLSDSGYKKDILLKIGESPIDITPNSGVVDLNLSGSAANINILGNATAVKISSADITKLSITSTGDISGIVDTSGMTKLKDAKLSKLTGDITFNAPGSTGVRKGTTGTRSSFDTLDISDNTGLTGFTMQVNGKKTADVNNNTDFNVIPNFKKLDVSGNTGLVNIDLANCGIEAASLPITGFANTGKMTLDISDNGFTGSLQTGLATIPNLEKLVIKNSPASFTPWNGGTTSVSGSTTIDVASLKTAPLKEVDLSGSSHVGIIKFTDESKIIDGFSLKSHGGLTVNINEHNETAKKFNINGSIGTLNLTNNSLTTWSDSTIIGNWLTLADGSITNLNVDNDVEMTVASGILDFSSHAKGDAVNITFKSKVTPAVNTIKITDRTGNLSFENEKSKTSSSLTITSTGTSSALINLTLPKHNNSTGITLVDLNYTDIKFKSGKLPTVVNWAGKISDKALNLDGSGNNITAMGEFYGNEDKSGKYLSSKGYIALEILDIGGNKLTELNTTDQADTLHTLKFSDKTALLTYNLKGNSKIANESTSGDALAEVFNVTNEKLTHVDYSGCTQLGVGATPSLVTDTIGLDLNGNKLVVALLGRIPKLADVQLYNNSLSRADAVTTLPDSNDTSSATKLGLYFGSDDATQFHTKESVLNISNNLLKKIDFGNKNSTRTINLTYLVAAHNTGNTISEGVFISHEDTLKEVHLAGQTVGVLNTADTGLYLNNNINLTHLWGSTNTQSDTAPTPTKMDNKVGLTSHQIGLSVKENLDLDGSIKLFGTDGIVKFLHFNNTVDNAHEIKNANLKTVTAEDIQINDNKVLEKLNIKTPEIVISNLELKNNNLKTINETATSSVEIPTDKAKLIGVIIIDHNPLEQVKMNQYNLVEFVSMNNDGFLRGKATKFGRFDHKLTTAADMDLVGYAIDLSENAKLLGIDIKGNEVHGINLSKNPVFHSIMGTQNVNTSGAAVTRIGTATKQLAAFSPTVDGSLVVGTFNISETVATNNKLIFAGHYIKTALISKSSYTEIDLRRNDAKGEDVTMTGALASPVYLDASFTHQGVLELVDISNMKNPIDKLYLDENKLDKIDSTKSDKNGSKVVMNNTKFTPNAIMTLNKNQLTDVTIVPGNGTNLEVLKELQLNDNMLTNLNFSKMVGLTTLRVNRTVAGRNNFLDGDVNLSGAIKLKEFAPSTIVAADKATNDKITRRRPSRPNESYWDIETAVNDNGSVYNLDWTPKESFENITSPSPTPSFLTPFTPAANNTGFYHYVQIAGLNVEGCTDLVTLRVPGNHLTNSRMNLTKTPNIKFLDISGKHYLTAVDGEYVIPNTDKKETQTDYFYGTGTPPASYKDGLSGRLGGAFASIWPKAENIYIYNNQYTSFDIAQSAGSIINILSFNNKIASVEVSKASKLQVLDLERNYIRPTIVLPTQSLIIFRAGHNQISKYPNTEMVPSLQEIYLNHNNFPVDSIPTNITANQNLKVLNIAVNNFIVVPDPSSNLKLEEIYAFENAIMNMPLAAIAGKLKVLDLHLNFITSITKQLPNSLRYLDLSDNKFVDFDMPNIPTAMSSSDGEVTAHERRPSHVDDVGLPINSRDGFSGILNIRHNQITEIPATFHDAWVAFSKNSPTKIRDFYLEFNLLDIDIYSPNSEYTKGTQKWLVSVPYDYTFLLSATLPHRRAVVVPNLRFWHPLRQTYERAPMGHNYDIWFDLEDDREVLDSEKNIYQEVNFATMYARVISKKKLQGIGSGNPDILNQSVYNPADYSKITDIETGGVPERALTPRNAIAIMKARLVGPDTVWEPWEGVNGSKTDPKLKGSTGKKYNPTTGPK